MVSQPQQNAGAGTGRQGNQVCMLSHEKKCLVGEFALSLLIAICSDWICALFRLRPSRDMQSFRVFAAYMLWDWGFVLFCFCLFYCDK